MDGTLEKSILIVGMPATGKTSFLAALQHYIDSDIPDKKLEQYKYSPDSEYLNKIHNRWLDCQQQPRTSQDNDSNSDIELFLRNTTSNDKITLRIPDIAGEAFVQHWQLRSWNEEYKQLVETSSGVLFFIHSENIIAHSLITDAASVFGDLVEDSEITEIVQWNPNNAPTQVIAVDILQQHLEYLPKKNKVPVVFIISAWDKVISEIEDIVPESWLKLNMPLLHQFLVANNETIEFNIYGISAQGGDFNQQTIIDRLQSIDEPAERIIVQDKNIVNNDISAPILWVMNKWKI